MIAHSTMETEVIALVAACKEVKWLRDLLLDIKLWPRPMPSCKLYCDSETTMSRDLNKVYNDKSRHISCKHEYLRQMLRDGVMEIVHVRTYNN